MSHRQLDLVFGGNSVGNSPHERAATSSREFVRSQVQIAFADGGGTGRRLSSVEALGTYGFEMLLKVALEGSVAIVEDREEPSRTLRRRREALNVSPVDVAKAAKLSVTDVLAAETPGKASPVRKIEAIAQALALDERLVGYQPSGGGDLELGVRLREMAAQKDAFAFSATTVLKLSESAWIVSRQNELAELLGWSNNLVRSRSLQSRDYSYPAYQRGYELAEKVRNILEIPPLAPIPSLRKLIERTLGIPLIQESLDDRFAGATIANGRYRGIVVNERGLNESVWVRRMTLAHELGHLFGDPDDRLNRLRVDVYDGIEADAKSDRDLVEMRANGFAVAFLAPRDAVLKISRQEATDAAILSRIVGEYGISRTAATYHIRNIANIDVSKVHSADLIVDQDNWKAQENLTVDYFPIISTPITRRGFFAYLVAKATQQRLISLDTAAAWLKCHPHEFEAGSKDIIALSE